MAPVNAQRLMGKTTTVQSAAIAPQQQLVASPADTAVLNDISKSLTNIIQLLSQQNNQTKRDTDQTRKEQERSRRKGIELGLEQSFANVKNVAQSIISPVKNILDQIIQFFVTIFLGRALILLLNWFADEKNRSKIRSIMRFLQDWWPSLVAGYILFGTGFGRVVRKVAGIAIGATARLVVIAARLTKAILTGKGLKGAAAAFSGGGRLGGLKGFALRGGLAAAATIGTGMAVNSMMSGGEKTPQLDVPEAPTTPSMGAAGGGFTNIKDLFSNSTSGLSSKVSPFTSFFGSGGLASLMQGVNGTVSGQKGIDKVPAMLTDGEFVMSRGAVQKFGVSTLESMNAAGGGTNQPKIIRGIPHAAGGGWIGRGESQAKYDAKHGEGAYDKESARRKAQYAAEDAAAEAKKNRKPTYIESPYVKQLKEQAAKNKGKTESTLTLNGINIPGGGQLMKSIPTDIKAPNIDANKIASSLATSTISNAKRLGINVTKESGNEEANRKALAAKRPWWDKAGLFGGGSRVAKDEAKQSKVKSQKKSQNNEVRKAFGNIFDNPDLKNPLHEKVAFGDMTYEQFKKEYSKQGQKPTDTKPEQKKVKGKEFTSPLKEMRGAETSQQRLNRLSSQGAGPKSGLGVRARAESASRKEDFEKRGGLFGQIGRGFTSMFGSQKDIDKNKAADKSSQVKTKQAGAESIGKYYSSSDGKYYGNYEQAQKARKARLASTKPKSRGITPTPKPSPKIVTKPKVAGAGMGGKRGSGSKPSTPSFSASSGSNRKAANIYGIK